MFFLTKSRPSEVWSESCVSGAISQKKKERNKIRGRNVKKVAKKKEKKKITFQNNQAFQSKGKIISTLLKSTVKYLIIHSTYLTSFSFFFLIILILI